MEIEEIFFDTSNYTLTNEKLGEGAFGKVYVVEDDSKKHLYAAKIINTNGVFNSRDQMLFLRESLILHKLSHPSIVKFYGINLHSFDNLTILSPTILTEYYPNGSLKIILDKQKNKISDAKWSATKKYICLLGISDAMRYLHREGIVHRDLKPGNVLIDENYYPKVCDFGLSRCFNDSLTNSMRLTMTGQVGSPLYMAPELFADEEHFSPSVDVYAFSIMAYEIITGQEPYSENGKPIKLIELVKNIPNGTRPEIPSNVKDNMNELIQKCWSENPSDRPSFDYIFEKLSTDFSHSSEKIDENEVNQYLETLRKCREETNVKRQKNIKELTQKDEEIKKLQDENEKLKSENKVYKEEIKKLQIELADLSNTNTGKCIHVKICMAQKILNLHLFEKPSSYVTLRLKSQPISDSIYTKTIPNTNNPVWNEEFNLITKSKDDTLIINMYNKDEKGDEQIMDQLEFPVSEWRISNPVDRREKKIKLNSKKAGTLIFEVQAFPPVGEYSKASTNYRISSKIDQKSEKPVKILLLCGNYNVGLTSLMIRYVDNKFDENVEITIGVDFKIKYINIDGHKVKFHIWETAGQEKFRNISRAYLRGTNGIIICYDVTDRDTLTLTQYWAEAFKEPEFDKNIPIVLSGNKIDLNDRRQVSYEEGKQYALDNGWDYFETSAKENKGVDELFQFIATKSFMYVMNNKQNNH